jgi:molybdopterin-guanine dinucleotide biosynthesis protein A
MAAAPAGPGPGPARPEFEVVILAGGRAARLGGADKPGLVVGTATMVAAVTGAAAAAGARRVILVGPARDGLGSVAAGLPGGLIVVREDPPGGGPVPALRAGLARVRSPWVAALAADLPFLRGGHIRELLAAGVDAGGGAAGGAVLADDTDRAQWLAGCWAAGRLRSALAGYAGHSLGGLLGPLNPVLVSCPAAPGAPPPWLDCDTPAELAAARTYLEEQSREHS